MQTALNTSRSPMAQHFLLVSAFLLIFFNRVELARAGELKNPSTSNAIWDYTYPYQRAPLGDRNWYYGSASWHSTLGRSGSCGFPSSFVDNVDSAAVPDPRFSDYINPNLENVDGAACGQCYLVKCINIPRTDGRIYCNSQNPQLVRITDYDAPGTWSGGKWPNNHFDLKEQSFGKIASLTSEVVNIKWKRTDCPRSTPKWTLGGMSSMFWNDVVIYSTPLAGSVSSVWVKPSNKDSWYKGKRLYGSRYCFLGGFVFDSQTKVIVFLVEGKGSWSAVFSPIY